MRENILLGHLYLRAYSLLGNNNNKKTSLFDTEQQQMSHHRGFNRFSINIYIYI